MRMARQCCAHALGHSCGAAESLCNYESRFSAHRSAACQNCSGVRTTSPQGLGYLGWIGATVQISHITCFTGRICHTASPRPAKPESSPAARHSFTCRPCRRACLQVQLGAPPVPPLGVVPAGTEAKEVKFHSSQEMQLQLAVQLVAGPCGRCREIPAPAHLMVLSVRKRIHCGMGRFCLAFLASFILMRKVFCDGCSSRHVQQSSD